MNEYCVCDISPTCSECAEIKPPKNKELLLYYLKLTITGQFDINNAEHRSLMIHLEVEGDSIFNLTRKEIRSLNRECAKFKL